MMFTKSVFSFLVLAIPCAVSLTSTLVQTNSGPVRGKEVTDFGVYYYSFQGIPYAEAPTGELRFKPPVPKAPWTEIRNATIEGPVCPQAEGNYVKDQMSEDCLFINIYVPADATTALPVLVYVHGGEFKAQSGNSDIQYGPQLILKHDIIFITLNYRLGALGFLSLDNEEASGNAGLKDILLALKWVNANINRFGGDPNKITLGGNSAGAVAVHYLMLTEKSTGLFHQAILISGSSLGYRFLGRYIKENTLQLAEQMGIDVQTTPELLERLKQANAFDIVKAQDDIGNNDKRKGFRPFAPFVPSIEIEYAEAIITKNPKDIVEKGIPQNVPVLAGFNKDEGLKMYVAIRNNWQLKEYLNENFELCIPTDIEYPYGSNESVNLAKVIKEFYFDDMDISNETISNFVDLITDTMFAYNIDHWIDVHLQRADSKPVYYYKFGFDGELNWFKITSNVSLPGTGHADELGYIYITKATRPLWNNVNIETQQMSDAWTTFMTNFVSFGNPTPATENLSNIWLESDKQRNYLYLNQPLENHQGPPNFMRLQFWQNVYEEYNLYVENGGALEKKLVP